MFRQVVADALQDFPEGGHAMARRIREIGAREEGYMVVRCEKHGQGPAAVALRQQGMCGLVDPVEVGALLPVDLDIDEQAVHQGGGFRVLEGFVRHDMAPVAGGITDRQQDGLVFTARLVQCLCTPGIPVNRVGGVLQQVGAGFLAKMIAVVVRVAHGSVPGMKFTGQCTIVHALASVSR